VADLAGAHSLVADHPSVRAVTHDGDVLGARWSAGGSSSAPSAIEIRAAVDEAQLKADEAAARHERLHAQLSESRGRAEALQGNVEAALLALHESDAKLSAVAEQLAQLGQAARSASAEAARLDAARGAAEQARDRDLAGLCDLEERLHLAESQADEPEEPVADERDSLQAEVALARQSEMEARLAVRTGEERVRAVSGRAEPVLLESRKLPGKVTAGGAAGDLRRHAGRGDPRGDRRHHRRVGRRHRRSCRVRPRSRCVPTRQPALRLSTARAARMRGKVYTSADSLRAAVLVPVRTVHRRADTFIAFGASEHKPACDIRVVGEDVVNQSWRC